MHAQVIETRIEPERLADLEHAVRFELLPALREQPGFCGAMSLVDRERADTLLILLWETEEEAARSLAPGDAPLGRAFSTVAALVETLAATRTVWEVNARG